MVIQNQKEKRKNKLKGEELTVPPFLCIMVDVKF